MDDMDGLEQAINEELGGTPEAEAGTIAPNNPQEGAEKPAEGTELPTGSKITPPAVDEDPEFDLKGEKAKLSQILDWKKGHMMQSDYTKKTQEFSQQQKAFEQQQKDVEHLRQLDKLLTSDKRLGDIVVHLLKNTDLNKMDAIEVALGLRDKKDLAPELDSLFEPDEETGELSQRDKNLQNFLKSQSNTISTLKNKLSGYETNLTESQQKEQTKAQEAQLQEALGKAYSGYDFDSVLNGLDDEGKNKMADTIKSLVLFTHLASGRKTPMEQLTQQMHQTLNTWRDGILKGYTQKKTGLAPLGGKTGIPGKTKEQAADLDNDEEMSDLIAQELATQAASRS